eukprot:COSAG03_NODE_248_length_10015_cov_44.389673_5_plen_160_part_00
MTQRGRTIPRNRQVSLLAQRTKERSAMSATSSRPQRRSDAEPRGDGERRRRPVGHHHCRHRRLFLWVRPSVKGLLLTSVAMTRLLWTCVCRVLWTCVCRVLHSLTQLTRPLLHVLRHLMTIGKGTLIRATRDVSDAQWVTAQWVTAAADSRLATLENPL